MKNELYNFDEYPPIEKIYNNKYNSIINKKKNYYEIFEKENYYNSIYNIVVPKKIPTYKFSEADLAMLKAAEEARQKVAIGWADFEERVQDRLG